MIKFCAVGDIMMGGKVEVMIQKYGPEYLFQHVAPILTKSDICFGNLEAPLTNETKKVVWDYSKIIDEPIKINGKTYGNSIFCRAPPVAVNGLLHARINVVSVANNHIMDYGKNGLYDTLNVLLEHGIKPIGAGTNLNDARKPVILQIDDIKVGFLAYCDVYIASKTKPGVVPTKYVEDDVKQLRDSVDILIVSIHQGMDIIDYPLPNEIKLMHSIIDYGADLILKHHPHVVNGIEHYNGGVIVYSMGNFVFDYTIDPLWNELSKARESMIFQCKLSKSGVSEAKIIPTYLNDNFQPTPASGDSKNIILSRIDKLSSELENKTPNPDAIKLQQEYAKIQTALAYHAIIDSVKKKRLKNIFLMLNRIKPYHLKLFFAGGLKTISDHIFGSETL